MTIRKIDSSTTYEISERGVRFRVERHHWGGGMVWLLRAREQGQSSRERLTMERIGALSGSPRALNDWQIFFYKKLPTNRLLAEQIPPLLYRAACKSHEDCRANLALARACFAERKRKARKSGRD